MAANTQNFRVKHGLEVIEAASFSNTITIAGNVTSNVTTTGQVFQTTSNTYLNAANVFVNSAIMTIQGGSASISSNVNITGANINLSVGKLTLANTITVTNGGINVVSTGYQAGPIANSSGGTSGPQGPQGAYIDASTSIKSQNATHSVTLSVNTT